MTTSDWTAEEINAVIRAGGTVYGRNCDVQRRGQPPRGVDVRLTAVVQSGYELRAYAAGYKGRFRVEIVGGDLPVYDS